MPGDTSPFHGHIQIEPPLSAAQRDFINSLPFPLSITADGRRAVFSGESAETRMPTLWTATLIDTYLRLSPEVMRGKACHRRDQGVPDFTGHLCNGVIKCRGHHDITVLNNRVGKVLCYPAQTIEWLNEPEDEAAVLELLSLLNDWEWRPRHPSDFLEGGSFVGYGKAALAKYEKPYERRYGQAEKLDDWPAPSKRTSFSPLLSFSYRLETDATGWLLKNHDAIRDEIGIHAMNGLLMALIGGEAEARRFAEILVPGLAIEEKEVEGDPGRVAEYVRVIGRTEHDGAPLVVDVEVKMPLHLAIVQTAITAWGTLRRQA